MMERDGDSQVRVMIVDLELFVPGGHLLRQIKSKVDFNFIYGKVKDLYKDGGRPSIDPVRLIKMWLVGYLYGIDSERRLEQEVHLNLAYRWFLGIQLDERVPDHSTLSANRNGRFKGSTLFLDIFEGIVEQCKQAGLVKSQAVVTDSTHVKANASDASAEFVTVTKAPREYVAALADAAREKDTAKREQLGKKKRGSKADKESDGEGKKRTIRRSTTDPDAGYMNRPNKPKGFHYLAHLTIEPSHGIILNATATAGNVNDHEPYVDCIEQAMTRHEIEEAAADAGYDRAEVHARLAEMGITSYTPAVEHISGSADDNRFTVRDFEYDPQADSYVCPAGNSLPFKYVARDKAQKIYSASQKNCKTCPLRDQCLAPSAKFRKLKRPLLQEHLDQAHERTKTDRYRELLRLRTIWCEGTNATLKARHCLRRAMRRGLHNMREQLLMAAAALNIRRLVANHA
ncbi:MAG TPA: IS1182 family transposase [Symbiobacteriaceae bacterium]|nr:IS1182 family transposase [Symbiobacteriaceae bacterium]